ncbi:MAG: DUF5665 domain-containing protein [Candidatus Saccharimonadales bacterium]
MDRIKTFLKKRNDTQAVKKESDAKRVVLEELFNDIYHNRKLIYKVNFVRGLVFGAGSVLGGTIIITLLVWILSLFVNTPVIGEFFEGARDTIDQTTEKAKPE